MSALRGDGGMSVIELMVAAMISSIVILIASAGLASVTKAEQYTDHHSQALTSLRSATANLGREVRQATRIYSDSDARRIHLWIDRDRNEVASPEEINQWIVQDVPNGGARLVRVSSAGTAVIAEHLVAGDAFQYRRGSSTVSDPSSALVVRFTFTADTAPGRHAAARTVTSTVRLRNVA